MSPESRPALHRLSSQDALFINGETATVGMHTMGTLIIEQPNERWGYRQVVETVSARLHTMPPLRQRLLEVPAGLGYPLMADDPDFRIENHMHRIAVPTPGSMRELAEIVGDVAARPLVRSQPLWEMWVIEGLAEGRMALVMKLHHCMLDGATGANLMGTLMDLSPDGPGPEAPEEPWNPPPLPSALELAWDSVGTDLPTPAFFGRLALKTWRGVTSRRRAQLEMTQEGEEPPPFFGMNAPMTRINRTLSGRRSVAYGSVPLEDLKTIKSAYGVTVNDAVLAATALMLRRYLEARDDLPEDPLYCVVPVSTKTIEEKTELSNKVSTFAISLPTHLDEPEAIIEFVKHESEKTKYIFEAVEEDVLPDILSLLPAAAIAAIMQMNGNFELNDRLQWTIANVVVSNMMGPPVPLYFGGAKVEAVYPMGPVAHGLGLNLTLLSNMGRIDLGAMACPDNVPDVWAVTEGFTQAVAELKSAAEKLDAEHAREHVSAPEAAAS